MYLGNVSILRLGKLFYPTKGYPIISFRKITNNTIYNFAMGLLNTEIQNFVLG